MRNVRSGASESMARTRYSKWVSPESRLSWASSTLGMSSMTATSRFQATSLIGVEPGHGPVRDHAARRAVVAARDGRGGFWLHVTTMPLINMSRISIIGTGNMGQAIAGVFTKGGHSVQLLGQGDGSTAVTGDIVVLAVPYGAVASIVAERGESLRARPSWTSPTR